VQDSWPFLPPVALLLALLLFAALVAVLVQSWRLTRQRQIAQDNRGAMTREDARRDAAHARTLRASDGEADASALLTRSGYAVLERQVAGSWKMRADGEPVTFGLRADYLVAREGRRYIAEVKTGQLAPRLSHGPTRRQLLEYGAAFDVHGVLLVDADRETITHVEIDLFDRSVSRPSSAARRQGVRAVAVTLVALVSFFVGALVGSVGRPSAAGSLSRWAGAGATPKARASAPDPRPSSRH
jgi:hypothetical protein